MSASDFFTLSSDTVAVSERWAWRRLPASTGLTRSISGNGVLSPLLVLRQGDAFELVDGHRRVSLLGPGHTLPVRLVPDEETAWRWKVTLDMAADPYTEIEKAGVVTRILAAGILDPGSASTELIPLLGLKPGLRMVAACRAVDSLPESMYRILLDRKAPIAFAERLSRESETDLQLLANWLRGQRLSLSRMMSVVDDILTIRDREGISVAGVLAQLAGDTAMDRLAAWRSPRSTAFRIRLKERLKRYRGWLSFPRDLEGDAYTFQAVIRNPDDARTAIHVLEQMAEDEGLFAPLQELASDD